ncbi:MAG: class I SAM-dependent methyltransferase [Planctomycetota bacterium]
MSRDFSAPTFGASVAVGIAPDAGPKEVAYVSAQLAEYRISLIDSNSRQNPALYLRWDGSELSVESGMSGKTGGGVRQRWRAAVDFSAILNDRARRLTRRQPLAKAVGHGAARIMDATAGFGQDALLLALHGHDVTAMERSPIVQALLADGVRRARTNAEFAEITASRLRFVAGDSRDWLTQQAGEYDVVYLDPMFPLRRKTSALPNKHAQLLQRLTGENAEQVELESAELLLAALGAARVRVVVKRPHDAPPIRVGASAPHVSFKSKLVRYDVYLRSGSVQS